MTPLFVHACVYVRSRTTPRPFGRMDIGPMSIRVVVPTKRNYYGRGRNDIRPAGKPVLAVRGLCRHCFKKWLDAGMVPSHFLKQR